MQNVPVTASKKKEKKNSVASHNESYHQRRIVAQQNRNRKVAVTATGVSTLAKDCDFIAKLRW